MRRRAYNAHRAGLISKTYPHRTAAATGSKFMEGVFYEKVLLAWPVVAFFLTLKERSPGWLTGVLLWTSDSATIHREKGTTESTKALDFFIY